MASEDEKTDNYHRFVDRYSQFLEKTEIDTENINTIDLITQNEKGFDIIAKRVDNTNLLI